MTDSFRDVLQAAIKAGAEPEAAYETAVRRARKTDLVDHFRPVGVEEARHIRRLLSRSIENRAFTRNGGRKLKVQDVPTETVDVRSILGSATFAGSEGRTVTWFTATLADHEDRAEAQDALSASIARDAERHRRAAKLIREAGVETLAEVEDWSELLDEDDDEAA